ncbi:hypothetical protein ACFY0G_09380 [Streptomyces sp. NPDC001552]|uniref:hypothetical protein n=1 Tax=Streptomyces sp. NPDC001552 TaxID=3364587 RepID=UPI003680E3F4
MTKTIKGIGGIGTYEVPTVCPKCKSTSFVAPRSIESHLEDLLTPRGLANIAADMARSFSTLAITTRGTLLRCKKCRDLVLACPQCHQEFRPPGDEMPPDDARRICMKCDQPVVVTHGVGFWVNWKGTTHESLPGRQTPPANGT